jgi:hypothetical protein
LLTGEGRWTATRDVFCEEELAQLRGFPEAGRGDLIRYVTLTTAEETFVRKFRGQGNVLGAAVLLCTLPWLGLSRRGHLSPQGRDGALVGAAGSPGRDPLLTASAATTRHGGRPCKAAKTPRETYVSMWALPELIEAHSRALVSEGEVAEGFYREAIDRLGRTRLRPKLAASTCSTANGCATKSAVQTPAHSSGPLTRW